MSELIEKLRAEFQDEEYRHAYADECLDTMIATQIKVLREQRKMTQGDLATATGMKQPRIPLLEDATYSNWSVNTLKRFAKAFDVALSVKFETFSHLINDFENLSRAGLQRPKFSEDVKFQHRRVPFHKSRRRALTRSRRGRLLNFSSYFRAETTGAAATREAEANRVTDRKKPSKAEVGLANGPVGNFEGLGGNHA